MISEIIFSILLIVISIIWMIMGIFQLGFWNPDVSAGSGFIPTIFATLTLVSSILVIVSNLKKKKASDNKTTEEQVSSEDTEKATTSEIFKGDKRKDQLKPFIPVLFCIAAIFCLQLFGLVITVFSITLSWLLIVSHTEWKKSLTISAIFTLIIYLVFEFWLEIPFPGEIINL